MLQQEWSDAYSKLQMKILKELQEIQEMVLIHAPYTEIHHCIYKALEEIMLSDSEPDGKEV